MLPFHNNPPKRTWKIKWQNTKGKGQISLRK
jgi:hypothetical protein